MRRPLALPALLALCSGAFYEWGGPAARGVRELRAKQHDVAVRSLREGRADLPRSSALRYDEALALSGAGYPDSAATAYRDALTREGAAGRASAAYNLGNMAFRAARYDEAEAHYREALRIAPSAMDAKRNLEETIRRKREAKQPPAAAGAAGQDSSRGEGGAGPPPAGDPGGPPPADASGSRRPPLPRGDHQFTRAEAERWLEALERERRSGRRAPARAGQERRAGDRDW